jgi:phosphoribosylformimino-5-aminoimidazole carboxamide ribotide isomerase
MQIIPVLDLKAGQVVQGIQGERAHYRPVESVLTPSSEPLPVAIALHAETLCEALYIADLDAIEQKADHLSTIRMLSRALPVELWVDAGCTDLGSVQRWYPAGVDRVVVGSETLESMQMLDTIKAAHPGKNSVFSLDVKQGRVLSRSAEIRRLSPLDLLDRLATLGWSQVIVLALGRVGTGAGPDWSILERCRHAFPDLSLIAGGGVRTIEDLHRLRQLGMSGCLLASALHRGWVTGDQLRST